MDDVYSPPQDPLVILHEDAEVILVDNPSGLLSVPGKGEHLADCLIARLQALFPEALLVHRPDRDTSGVLLLARTRAAAKAFTAAMRHREPRKPHPAIVAGVPAPTLGPHTTTLAPAAGARAQGGWGRGGGRGGRRIRPGRRRDWGNQVWRGLRAPWSGFTRLGLAKCWHCVRCWRRWARCARMCISL